ncbi:MAG: glycogen/starch/alpha-glucan phosphorylase [Candidatus Nomurabacteria bacterium]|jgi:alpha-glucan phosphorylase-like protein|nr:glycogen/starch/alpha-glucan phosphorylase [Candidatus Nomurabacteria bacterium]
MATVGKTTSNSPQGKLGFAASENDLHLSAERPYTYFTMELYDQENGIRGGGGLGILAADTRRVAEQLDVPFVLVTPFYPVEQHQVFDKNHNLENILLKTHPSTNGFELLGAANLATVFAENIKIEVWRKQLGSTTLLTIYDPNFRELYADAGCSNHRLFQEVALGFAGYQALKLAGFKPSTMQLNETPCFFAALARLDDLVSNGMHIFAALEYVREHTLYTNHTLVQAAEASFTRAQFAEFVLPNLKSKSVARWVMAQFPDSDEHVKHAATDRLTDNTNAPLQLSSITLELAGIKSGVSKLHARIANYHDLDGNRIHFNAVTNGIDVAKWVLPSTLKLYHELDLLSKYNLPTHDYQDNLQNLTAEQIRTQKTEGRKILNAALKERNIIIPDDAIVFNFKRRFVDYKRPWLAFSDPNRLHEILVQNNAYYILAGRVHTGDDNMMSHLQQIMHAVAADPELKNRVFYLADYDEKLAYALSVGADIAINNPIVGMEACGTSWEKDLANLQILISTEDGGVADISPATYLKIASETESDEVQSLYQNMTQACKLLRDDASLTAQLQNQLAAYLPTISGARMLRDYLHLLAKQP